MICTSLLCLSVNWKCLANWEEVFFFFFFDIILSNYEGSYGKVMKAKYRGFDVAVKQMLTYDINDPNLDESQKKAVLQSYQDFRHEAWIMRLPFFQFFILFLFLVCDSTFLYNRFYHISYIVFQFLVSPAYRKNVWRMPLSAVHGYRIRA
jgi:hypothetical protein